MVPVTEPRARASSAARSISSLGEIDAVGGREHIDHLIERHGIRRLLAEQPSVVDGSLRQVGRLG